MPRSLEEIDDQILALRMERLEVCIGVDTITRIKEYLHDYDIEVEAVNKHAGYSDSSSMYEIILVDRNPSVFDKLQDFSGFTDFMATELKLNLYCISKVDNRYRMYNAIWLRRWGETFA